MVGTALPTDSEVRWIATSKIPTAGQKVLVYASFTALGNRVDVEAVGVSAAGVAFVRKGNATTIPWTELVPSRLQYEKGYLVLKAKTGTPARGGPWVVNSEQGRAILTEPHWPDPTYARKVITDWLS